MTPHDNSYKLLFSYPEMVRDLFSGFIHEPWVAELDFTTLEKVSGSYVADDLRDREDDIIWRVRFSVLQQARIKMALEEQLALPVDIITRQRGAHTTPFQRIAMENGVPL
jgi:predicted transposase YdaD